MSLLKTMLESAAGGVTSAGAIAGVRTVVGTPTDKVAISTKDGKKKKKKDKKMSMLKRMVAEAEQLSFDSNDVMSKMKAAEKTEDVTRDTVPFALEDSDGSVVKVYVRTEQADAFETALAHALDELENSTNMEISEVLFNLREKFDIVDVKWPEVVEDEEEAVAPAEDSGESDLPPDDAAAGDMGDGETDMTADDTAGEDADVKSAFQQVVDMMKTDAEAKKAEAKAKQAEAEAEAAKYAAQAAETKMRAEEEVLDMEAFYNKKAEADKEAKKLAKLARYRHEVSQDDEEDSTIPTENEEVDLTDKGGMDPQAYLEYVKKHLQAQN